MKNEQTIKGEVRLEQRRAETGRVGDMEMGGETVSLEQFGECEGQRGGGGKLRKSAFRKKQPTPYARPEQSQRRRWMSKLVDPAFRLISGGAARLLPSFFGSSSSSDDDSGEDRDKLAVELKQNDNGRAEDDTLEHITHTSLPIVSISSNKEANRLGNMSKIDQIREEKYKGLSNDMGLTEIEQLMMGKQFSRDEADNLIKILQSRAVDHQNVEPPVMAPRDSKRLAATHGVDEVPIEEKKENYNRSIMGPSTPLFQPTILDDVGASPIEIARAYMGTRTSDTLPSKIWASGVERTSLRANTSASDAFISSPAPNSSTCWPGSMAQNQLHYSTPYNQRDRYGLHNFPRTPYSRTIYSKPKSTLTQSQREDDKFFKASSPFGSQLRISRHESAKSSKDVSANAGGSVGPIRRLHHKSIAGSSSREPPYIQSSPFSQQAEFSSISKGTFPVIKKNVESGEMSSVTEFQSGDRTIHSHSSQIAQTILEHLNRHPPTPKEKEEEIRRAISWKRSESSLANESLPKQSRSQSLILGVSNANNSSIEANQNDSTQNNCNQGQSFFIKNTASASDTNGDNVKDKDTSSFKIRNSSEDVPKTHPVTTGKPLAQSSGSKPVLPSINIDRNSSKNMFSSESSSAFTFPVSESSGALFELPTPSFVPSISTILPPPSSASTQPQLKPKSAVPSYSFGSNRSSPPLVFSFPSSTNLSMENNDGSDIKFSFGSDNKSRLSFGGIGKDTICC